MLSVDRLMKCRTICGSVTSGRAGGEAAIALDGSKSSTERSGTSHAGNRAARRPGLERSNSSCVSRVFSIVFDGQVEE
jgi:hypothetical protein